MKKFALAIAFLLPLPAVAQEAAVVNAVGRQMVKTLGKDAVEFGGEAVAKQTARRLLAEAGESAGEAGGRVAARQLERVALSGRGATVFELKALSGKSLLLLDDVADDALPAAVSTLARPGVSAGIEKLATTAIQKAALAGETRLPGAGLKLVSNFGDDGVKLAIRLTEDQANSVIAALRPAAIKAMPAAERSGLIGTLLKNPGARVANFGGVTGPLVVVAGGVVVWHGIDVALAPQERVTEMPDGTVVREKISVGARAVDTVPAALTAASTPLLWTGVTFAACLSLVAAWRFRRRPV